MGLGTDFELDCSSWILDSASSHLCCSTSCGGSAGEPVYKSNCHIAGKLSWQKDGRERSTLRTNSMTSNGLNDHTWWREASLLCIRNLSHTFNTSVISFPINPLLPFPLCPAFFVSTRPFPSAHSATTSMEII